MAIEDGKFVQIEYTGKLDDGTVFDSTEQAGGQPLEFQIGAQQVIPGFEDAVREMGLDEEKEVIIPSDQAYGDPNPELIHDFPKSEAPEGEELTVGQRVMVTNEAGMPFTAHIIEITDENIKLDLNHPLAGKTLHFTIKVVGITDESTQPVHSCGCGCDDGHDHC